MAVGLLATALLLANNLRDIATDRQSGKRTLAVRVGRRAGGWCYVACVALPFVGVAGVGGPGAGRRGAMPSGRPGPPAPAGRAAGRGPGAARPSGDAEGRALLPVLAATGRLQLAFGALLALALWLTLPPFLPALSGLPR